MATASSPDDPAAGRVNPTYRWQVVAMLWLVCFFNYADRQAIYAVFPLIGSEFGFDKVQLGLTGTLFIHLASAASAPLAGIAADRLASQMRGGRIVIQLLGLLLSASCVATVGLCTWTPMLLAAMTAFGLCKGCYDTGIFTSLFDHVRPEARASAAGIMNTVGWGGGALGPLFVGLMSRYGGGNEIDNMSRAIALGGGVYLVAAFLLAAAALIARRQA